VLATCRCLLEDKTCVPSYVLGTKWGADRTWRGEVLPGMAPFSSIPTLAAQDYGLSPAARCQIQMSVVSDLEIRLAGQIRYLELGRGLNTHP